MLITVDGADRIVYDRYKPRNAVPDTLDAQIVRDARASSRTARRCSCPTRCRTPPHHRHADLEPYRAGNFGMRNSCSPTT
jgi:glutamate synthase (NADPH/NADH) large chain